MPALDISSLDSFSLHRYPPNPGNPLQAWNSADQHLLREIEAESLLEEDTPVLILNDEHGALTCALHRWSPIVVSDSYTTHQAILQNLEYNGLDSSNIQLLNSLEAWPEEALKGALVLIKFPKSLSLFESYLQRLRPHLSDLKLVLCGGMEKHMSRTLNALLEKHVGPTSASRGWKKSRLLRALPTPEGRPKVTKDCSTTHSVGSWSLHCHPNVFSRQHLDAGTAMLLLQIPPSEDELHIVDLGCGSGILSIEAAHLNPYARISAVDESFMAVTSTQENVAKNQPDRTFEVRWGDTLEAFDPESVDLILCNPPFHDGQALSDHIASRMIHQSRRVLRRGGRLLLVGNRHLEYHQRIARYFRSCKTVASSKTFVVLNAQK